MAFKSIIAAVSFAAIAGLGFGGSPVLAGGRTVVLTPKDAHQAQGVRDSLRLLGWAQGARGNAVVDQRGRNNAAGVAQHGSGNLAIVGQRGSNNSANLAQNGNNNALAVFQIGRNRQLDASQTGNGKTAIIVQTGR